jgi:DNA repair exonuclease SbcCD nuclease subunit
MKIAVITDTHYGAKKGSKNLHDYFELFYENIFFPTLEKYDVKSVIHMGDAFDSRKSIDYQSLEWSKRVVFDNLKKYDVHMIIGNHDVYYKDTNNINSPDLLLKTYNNITTYKDPSEVKIGNLNILFLPWINKENQEKSFELIKKTNCKCAMGHLEFQGFRVNKQIIMEHGLDSKSFDKFDRVFSGHYHTRSDNGKIFYLGNPYEMYWTDVDDTRGFHIFDTETLELIPINNTYKLFYNIYYDDTPIQTFNFSKYKNKIVKVVVRKKSKPKEFDKFIDKLNLAGVEDLKIIENFIIIEKEDFEVDEEENTMSILNRYIDDSEFNLDKGKIKMIFQDIYRQSCEVT